MRENFTTSLASVLSSEAGYANHPADKGGPTNKGITQSVYDTWRMEQGLGGQGVKLISLPEASAIYAQCYWAPCHCDQLPSGVDYATFDFAVNSGVNRACRFLQRAVGVTEDGVIGPATLAAINSTPPGQIIDKLCDLRLAFDETRENANVFGRGWANRVAEVRAKAKGMVR
jgi:lysozyme family protein